MADLTSRLKKLQPETSSSRRRNTDAVPRKFVDFCAWQGVTLSPAQKEIARVAYDGEQPTGDLAASLFGVGEIAENARAIVCAVCGGRGGKSYVLIALRLVWGMLVRDVSSAANGQRAVALVIAPNDTLRQEVVNYALGAVQSRPELAAMLIRKLDEGDTPSGFALKRPDGHIVTFEAGVATRGGYGGRGRSLTDVALDEVAFFRDSSYKVSDKDIFAAASARVLPGGQAIVASTPWGESGLLYELWSQNRSCPKTAIVIHAPTEVLNPSPWAKAIVERERKRDPDNARREYDAQFMSGGTTEFFDGGLIEQCIDRTLEARTPLPGETVLAGADVGFRADSSALVIAHRVGDVLTIAEVMELRPEPGKPLKPSDTIKLFADRIKAHGCTYVMADSHYRETVAEHLDAYGLQYVPAPSTPAEAYVRARMLMRDGRVRIPDNQRLIQQLREVQGRATAGGGVSIQHPRWRTGGHGDICAAMVLALYQAVGDVVQPSPADVDIEEQMREERRRSAESRHSRKWWDVHERIRTATR